MAVLTRRGTIGKCSCKVGACRKCGSSCKRCKCSCDGVSPLAAMLRYNNSRRSKKRCHRISGPKRLKIDDRLVPEPKRTKRRNGANENDEDSEFTPTSSIINNEVSTIVCEETFDSALKFNTDDAISATIFTDIREEFWKDIDISFQTVLEFQRIIHSSQQTKAIVTLSDYVDKVLSPRNTNRTTGYKFIKIGEIQKECMLPPSTMKELGLILFGINKLKDIGVTTRGQKRGKNLLTLTAMRARILHLSSKCNTKDDVSVQIYDDTTSNKSHNSRKLNDSDNDSSKTETDIDTEIGSSKNNMMKKRDMVQTKASSIDNENDVVDTNIDRLTDQVLDLPREFRPIRLAHDQTISKKQLYASLTNDSIAIDVPTLPEFSKEIYVDKNGVDNAITNDEELTVSCVADITEPNEINKMQKKIESEISKLIDLFKLPQYQKTVLPSVVKRKTSTNLYEDNQVRYSRMVLLGHKLVSRVIQSLCPGPSRPTLQKDILKRMVRGHEVLGVDSDEARYQKMTHALCLCTKMSNRNTIERKVCRALLYNGVTSTKHLQELMKKYNFSFANGEVRKNARLDFESLSKGETLKIKTPTFSRIDDDSLLKAVKFILSEDNCISTSYGTKTERLSDTESIQLPRFQRKRSRIDLIRAYLNITSDDETQVSQRSMYNIVNFITASDQASLYAIDYVTSLLVNETGEVMQDIIDKLLSPQEGKEASRLLCSASYFLKHVYKHHVLLNDDVCYHGLVHALKKPESNKSSNYSQTTSTSTTTTTTTTTKLNKNCNACKFPFFVCTKVKQYLNSCSNHIEDQVKDALEVVDDVARKYELYMAHIARCTNQVHAINKKEKELVNMCRSSKGKRVGGMLIIDFKMKFEAQSTRESTVEHFGKRGISWHGCALVYYLYEIKKDDNDRVVLDSDGNDVYYEKKYLVYIDQILMNSNKQDGMSVVGLLEACLTSIHNQLPFISQLTIQSDNATTYQNGHLIIGIHLLNIKMRGKVFVDGFIHTETQHGKTILDAHFASTNRHLKNFMLTYTQNRVTRIQTPLGLAYALSFNTGVRNTMVQLIELDEAKLEEISIVLEPVVKHSKNFFTRLNHIYYDDPIDNDCAQPDDIMANLSTLKFNLKVQSFTNIDDPFVFVVDMEHNTFNPAGLMINQHNDVRSNDDPNYEDAESNSNDDNNVTVRPVTGADFTFSKVRGSHTRHNLRTKSIIDIEKVLINEDEQDNDDTQNELSSDDEDYKTDISEEDNSDTDTFTGSVANSDIRQYGPPAFEDYNVAKMITKVKVVKLQEFGKIFAFKKRQKKDQLSINIDKVIPVRKDSYAKAVRYAKQIVSTSDYFHDQNEKTNALYNLSSDYTPDSNFAIRPSWARRKGYGQLYGETYMDNYKDELLKMFNDGCSKNENKMNPGKMRENLMNMFPHKFSIPSELEIKKFITSQSQKQKYKSKTNKSKTRVRKRNGTMVWKSSLIPLIEENVSAKPEQIYNMFAQAITIDGESLPQGLPMNKIVEIDKKRIKAIINQERDKIKRRAKRDLI